MSSQREGAPPPHMPRPDRPRRPAYESDERGPWFTAMLEDAERGDALVRQSEDRRREFLRADLAAVDQFLATLPRQSVLERIGFASRRESILEELQTL